MRLPLQGSLLFYITIKADPIVRGFHFEEVTKPAWKESNRNFYPFGYQVKMDEFSHSHENVGKWSGETQQQMIKMYQRILKESGFLNIDSFV